MSRKIQTEPFTLKIDPATKELLRVEAFHQRVSSSEIVRQYIAEGLERRGLTGQLQPEAVA
jgi:hypothetical protein